MALCHAQAHWENSGQAMNKENFSNVGTIAVSLLATSCCIGPAIFIVFGTSVGFLGNLSFMEPLRPYFLGAAFLLAGFSFWKLHLRKRIECACEEDMRTRKTARVIFWVGVVALIFAASFQPVLLWFYG